jgi:hypothetical protein
LFKFKIHSKFEFDYEQIFNFYIVQILKKIKKKIEEDPQWLGPIGHSCGRSDLDSRVEAKNGSPRELLLSARMGAHAVLMESPPEMAQQEVLLLFSLWFFSKVNNF